MHKNEEAQEEQEMDKVEIRSHKEITEDTRVGDLVGWNIESPAQQEAKKQYKQRKTHKEREFTMMKRDFVSEAKEGLNLGEMGLLLFLSRYMKYEEEGKLIRNSKRMTVSDIAKLVKKSERQIRTILDELEKRSLLYKVKEGRNVYVELSEDAFVCGSLNGSDARTVKIFKKRLGQVAKQLSLNELGFFMMMLENMHWQTNILVDNPDEFDSCEIVLWSRNDLCEATEVSKRFLSATLSKLMKIEAIVELRSVHRALVLHPSLVSRQVVTPTWDDLLNIINGAELTKYNMKKNQKQ